MQKWLPVLQLNPKRCRVGGGRGGGARRAMRMQRARVGWSHGFGHSVIRSTLASRATNGRSKSAATTAAAATAAAAANTTSSTVGGSVKDPVGSGARAKAGTGLGGRSIRGEDYKTGTPPSTAPGAHLSHRTRLWILGFSAVAFVLGGYVSSKFVGNQSRDKTVAAKASQSVDTAALEQSASSTSSSDPATVYERPGFATTFDSETSFHELIWGILSMRQRLAEQATGRVIEVGAGTGRNTEFYQLAQCDSVTLLDQSGAMLDVARKKWEESKKNKIKEAEEGNNSEERRRRLLLAEVESGKVKFLQKSIFDLARSAMGSSKKEPDMNEKASIYTAATDNIGEGEGNFDTVVETMSLCSTQTPDALLQSLGAVVKPESGRILLLEHGRSKYGFLNGQLDKSAEPHAEKFGCWWNRDVGALVERSGLEVLEMRRHHLGTTWWVVLRRPIGWEPKLGEEEKEMMVGS